MTRRWLALAALAVSLCTCRSEGQQAMDEALAHALETGELGPLLAAARADPTVLERRSESSATALHVAAKVGSQAAVKELLSRGASAAATMKNGATPLFVAIYSDEPALIPLLRAAGSPVDARASLSWQVSVSALHVAALLDKADMVQVLLAAGADVEAKDSKGATPLVHAASEDALAVVRLLIGRADLEAARADGKTAAHVAACAGRATALRLLLDAGARADAPDARGITPLLCAVAADQPQTMAILLAAGAHADGLTCMDEQSHLTPLMAALDSDKPATLTLVRALLAAGADSNAAGRVEGVDVMTPLLLAVQHAPPEAVDALLAAGADPNQADAEGTMPLHLAAAYGRLETARRLLAHGAVPDVRPDIGRYAGETPSETAERRGHPDVVALLRGR